MIRFKILFLTLMFLPLLINAGETPSPEGAKAYFIDLKDGDNVKSPLLVRFGLTEQMGIAPALADWPDTGHFHLIIDSKPPNPNRPISNRHLHLHKGQTEAIVELKQGQHTLQIVMGDYSHIPHDPPVMSKQITVNVD
ncbi:MAG: DUF4399 domain-containing protein [SAR324 cluster bacterium]|jgi:hypothetical protein|nr:DUF4399 domain-containing protein [SAR324 cluster bacterium]